MLAIHQARSGMAGAFSAMLRLPVGRAFIGVLRRPVRCFFGPASFPKAPGFFGAFAWPVGLAFILMCASSDLRALLTRYTL